MKVFVAIVLIISSVSARGSGPYLPSGWRPEGPAFYLPSEVARPAAAPVQESQFQDTEASGSDALREYGPPKLEVSVNQDLPDVATAQTFFVDVKNEEVAAVDDANVDATTVAAAAILEVVSTTESVEAVEVESKAAFDAEPTGEADVGTSEEITEQIDDAAPTSAVAEDIVPTAAVEEEVVSLAQQELVQEVPTPISEVVATVNLVQEAVEDTVSTENRVSEGVNNIAEALINLEKEVKAIEVQAIENSAEVSSTQEVSGDLEQNRAVVQVPEGFLEYGPPGFTEYGPPKQEDLARLAIQVATAKALENNEVRRRRFSPKLRLLRSLKKH